MPATEPKLIQDAIAAVREAIASTNRAQTEQNKENPMNRENMLPCRWTIRNASNPKNAYVHIQMQSVAQNVRPIQGTDRYTHAGNRPYGDAFDVPLEQFTLVYLEHLTVKDMLVLLTSNAQQDTRSLATDKTYNKGWLKLELEGKYLSFFPSEDTSERQEGWVFSVRHDQVIVADLAFAKLELARLEFQAKEQEVLAALQPPAADPTAATPTEAVAQDSACCQATDEPCCGDDSNDDGNDDSDTPDDDDQVPDWMTHRDVPDPEVAE